ncbi:MAG: diaminopimelate epimerase [Candidatus Marinimicrobia bacterium]|jgi:diaminopimelate epimerase|nr:diaminopimelate epimerase [Candidatus Neomarinimicrobiota bacterium]MBT3631730.1 diaminopimelate epimerase [Candidatus Neomarinimicrobiota bacterium]MBT3826013.1 diaminopimelate epimerase [Candidatus Neomarinimicrobiota bacterium]MBT4129223.1 diaminopimelate epimerase [Candidatus Neomarinimicrobiota bacterium]MBT4294930.1 diaminopimelate epimerase [Candidatus Neomarinimicrobiota bacterium]
MSNTIDFYKYVGAGNDFVVFESWKGELKLAAQQIIDICDRRFGIGADGVLLLKAHQTADFQMNYYNADGSRGEMCGNGARCLVRFAELMGRVKSSGTFLADDGIHHFNIQDDLIDVEIIVNGQLLDWEIPQTGCGFIDTGVPHLVIPVSDIVSEDLDPLGREMNSHAAHPQGINVNIVEKSSETVRVRTWERGVNMETLACGTGAAATAIFAREKWNIEWPIQLSFPGGDLEVDYRGDQYWLKGPAQLVFKGHLSLSRLYRN